MTLPKHCTIRNYEKMLTISNLNEQVSQLLSTFIVKYLKEASLGSGSNQKNFKEYFVTFNYIMFFLLHVSHWCVGKFNTGTNMNI